MSDSPISPNIAAAERQRGRFGSAFSSLGNFLRNAVGGSSPGSSTPTGPQITSRELQYKQMMDQWKDTKDTSRLRKEWLALEKSKDEAERERLLLGLAYTLPRDLEKILVANKKTRASTRNLNSCNDSLVFVLDKIFPGSATPLWLVALQQQAQQALLLQQGISPQQLQAGINRSTSQDFLQVPSTQFTEEGGLKSPRANRSPKAGDKHAMVPIPPGVEGFAFIASHYFCSKILHGIAVDQTGFSYFADSQSIETRLRQALGDSERSPFAFLELLLLLAEKDTTLGPMCDAKLGQTLLKVMHSMLRIKILTEDPMRPQLELFLDKVALLLRMLVHSQVALGSLRSQDNLSLPFTIILEDINMPQDKISQNFKTVKRMMLDVIDEMARALDGPAAEHLAQKKIVTTLLNTVKQFDSSNIQMHDQIALCVDTICRVIAGQGASSASSSQQLMKEFVSQNGYSVLLDKIIECEQAFSAHSNDPDKPNPPPTAIENALQQCANLSYVGDRDLQPLEDTGLYTAHRPANHDTVSPPSPSLSIHVSHSQVRRVRNLHAFQSLSNAFLRTPNSNIHRRIIEIMLNMFAEDPINYAIVHHLHNLAIFIRILDDLTEDIQHMVIKLLEFVVTGLNYAPFEELNGLVAILQSGIGPSLAVNILQTIFKLTRFDASFKDRFRDTRLLPALVGLLRSQFGVILTHSSRHVAAPATVEEREHAHKTLLLATVEVLTSMLENSHANVQHFREIGALDCLQEMLVRSELYRDCSLQILQIIIAQDTFQSNADVNLLVEVLQTSSKPNSTKLKISIFKALKKMFQANERAKDSFRDSGFVSSVSVIINSPWPENDGKQPSKLVEEQQHLQLELMDQLFRALTAALHNHPINKLLLVKLIGEMAIVDALKVNGVMKSEHKLEVLQFLLDFATERTMVSSEDEYASGFIVPRSARVSNAFAISFMLHLMEPKEDPTTCVQFFIVLDHIVSASLANLQALTDIEVTGSLVKVFRDQILNPSDPMHPALMRLIERTATYNLSSAESRALFSLLKEKDHPSALLDLLLKISQNSDSTPFVEIRDGSAGCYVRTLLEDESWAPNSGYSFSSWVYCHDGSGTEAVASPSPSQREFVLLQIESTDARSFLKIAINEATRGIEISTSKTGAPVRFVKGTISPNRWHHVVVSHQRNRLQSSIASLFIDGVQEDTQKVSFIGSASTIAKTRALLGRLVGHGSAGVSWRLGSAFLVEEIMTSSAVASVFVTSSAYTGCFQGDYIHPVNLMSEVLNPKYLDLLENDNNVQSKSVAADVAVQTSMEVKAARLERFVFAFNARHRRLLDYEFTPEDADFLDITLPKNQLLSQSIRSCGIFLQNMLNSDDFNCGSPIALLVNNTAYCTPSCLSDNIYHTDGLIVVLALVERAETTEYLDAVLMLLSSLMETYNTKVQNELDRLNAYQIIASILVNKIHLITSNTLSILWGMCTLGSQPGKEILTNMKAFCRWFLDFDIWSKTSAELQKEVIRRIVHSVRRSYFGSLNVARLKACGVVSQLLFRVVTHAPPLDVVSSIVDCIKALVEHKASQDDMMAISEFLISSLRESAAADATEDDPSILSAASIAFGLRTGVPTSSSSDPSQSQLNLLPKGMPDLFSNTVNALFQGVNKVGTVVAGAPDQNPQAQQAFKAASLLKGGISANRKRKPLGQVMCIAATRHLVMKMLVELFVGGAQEALDSFSRFADLKWFLQFFIQYSNPVTVVLALQLMCVCIDMLKDDRAFPSVGQALLPYCNQPDVYYTLVCLAVGKKPNYTDGDRSLGNLLEHLKQKSLQPQPQHFAKVVPILLQLVRHNIRRPNSIAYKEVDVSKYFQQFIESEKHYQAKRRWALLRNFVKGARAFLRGFKFDNMPMSPMSLMSKLSDPLKTSQSETSPEVLGAKCKNLNLSVIDFVHQAAFIVPEFLEPCKKTEFAEACVAIIFAPLHLIAQDSKSSTPITAAPPLSLRTRTDSRFSLGNQDFDDQEQTLPQTPSGEFPRLKSTLTSKPEISFLSEELAVKILAMLNALLVSDFSLQFKGTRLLEDILQCSSSNATDLQINSLRSRVIDDIIKFYISYSGKNLDECQNNFKLVGNLAQFSSTIVEMHYLGLLPFKAHKTSMQLLVLLCERFESVDAAKKRSIIPMPTFVPVSPLVAPAKESALYVAYRSLDRLVLFLLSPPDKRGTPEKISQVLAEMTDGESWLMALLNSHNKDAEFWSSMCMVMFDFILNDMTKIREGALICWKLMMAGQLSSFLTQLLTFKVPQDQATQKQTTEYFNAAEGFKQLLHRDHNSFLLWFNDESDKTKKYFTDNLVPVLDNMKNQERRTAHLVLSGLQSKNKTRRGSVAKFDRKGIEAFYTLRNECRAEMLVIREGAEMKLNARTEQDLIRNKIALDRWAALRQQLYGEKAVWANPSIFDKAKIDPDFHITWHLDPVEGPMRMRRRIDAQVCDEHDPLRAVKFRRPGSEDEEEDSEADHSEYPVIETPRIDMQQVEEAAGAMASQSEPTTPISSAHRRLQGHVRTSSGVGIPIGDTDSNPFIMNQLKMMEELQLTSPNAIRRTQDGEGEEEDVTSDQEAGDDEIAIESEENQTTSAHSTPEKTVVSTISPTDVTTSASEDVLSSRSDAKDAEPDDEEENAGGDEEPDIVEGSGTIESVASLASSVASGIASVVPTVGEDFELRKLLEPGDTILQIYNCLRIKGMDGQKGLFLICAKNMYLVDNFHLNEKDEIVEIAGQSSSTNAAGAASASATVVQPGTVQHACTKIPIEDLADVHKRRFLLRTTALEFFTKHGSTFFVVLEKSEMNKIHTFITSGKGPFKNIELRDSTSPANRQKMTSMWQRGEISNFEYLMYLNTCAGRTFNDLTQYPVFPWVLRDYTSDTLDLSNPEVYRDLSRPMGALNENRRVFFMARYDEWDDSCGIPKFHYGTHYSSAGIVMYYLMRLEPFMTQYMELQGGKFDVADRLFNGLQETWLSASDENSLSDVKELIPEFYYMPEFLINISGAYFGKRQSGEIVSDVQLPPWANNDPFEFIRLHRKALESDYVSEHLHEWIDLVFGFKQTGKEAAAACNVFFHLTYEGAVDIDAIQDEQEKSAVIAQISNFGQTPHQLMKKPHPRRTSSLRQTVSNSIERAKVSASPEDLVVTIDRSLALSGSTAMSSSVNVSARKHDGQSVYALLGPGYTGTQPVGQIFVNAQGSVVSLPHKCRLLRPKKMKYLSWGFPDNTLRMYRPHVMTSLLLGNRSDQQRYVWENLHWHAQINCVHSSEDGKTIVLGGQDSVVSLWRVGKKANNKTQLSLRARFCGHSKPVTCVAISDAHGIVVSGAEDGKCFVWDLAHQPSQYLRELLVDMRHPISHIQIDEQSGDIVVASLSHVDVFNINGKLLTSFDTGRSPISSLLLVPPSNAVSPMEWSMIVTGHANGRIKFWKYVFNGSVVDPSLPDLAASASSPSQGSALSPTKSPRSTAAQANWKVRCVAEKSDQVMQAVTALFVTRDGKKMYAGDSEGQVFVLTVDPDSSKRLALQSSRHSISQSSSLLNIDALKRKSTMMVITPPTGLSSPVQGGEVVSAGGNSASSADSASVTRSPGSSIESTPFNKSQE